MASILTASSYIDASGEKDYCEIDTVTILSSLIQNILGGHYDDLSRIHLDFIHTLSPRAAIVGAIIKGISLGGGTVKIYNKRDVERCVSGVQGKIAIIYELYGKVQEMDISNIQRITLGCSIDRENLAEPPSDNIEAINMATGSIPAIYSSPQETPVLH